MPRIYSADPDHNCDYGIDFINGAAAVPIESIDVLNRLDELGYDIEAGSDALSPWDYLTLEQLGRFYRYLNLPPMPMTKANLVSSIESTLIGSGYYNFEEFDAVDDVSAGTVAAPKFADAAAVMAALPTYAKATMGEMIAVVPVDAWVDTDTFDKGVAGTYTFTATLGDTPTPYVNVDNVTLTVEVVVAA